MLFLFPKDYIFPRLRQKCIFVTEASHHPRSVDEKTPESFRKIIFKGVQRFLKESGKLAVALSFCRCTPTNTAVSFSERKCPNEGAISGRTRGAGIDSGAEKVH